MKKPLTNTGDRERGGLRGESSRTPRPMPSVPVERDSVQTLASRIIKEHWPALEWLKDK